MKDYGEIEDGGGEEGADEWEDVEEGGGVNMDGEEGASTEEVGEGSHPCFLCHQSISHARRQDKLSSERLEHLKHIYGFSQKLFETLSSQPLLMCVKCRFAFQDVASGKKPPSALPNLKVSLHPLRPPVVKTYQRKDLLNMKSLTGANRTYKDLRPELAELLDQVKEFCHYQDYDSVEVGFFMLHNFLSSARKHKMARQLKSFYKNKTYGTMSPRKSIANKLYAGRSHRAHRTLALFLKQFTGRDIFPSRQAEDRFVEQLQPRSYSYKLFSLSDDPQCIRPFKEVQGLQRPKEPNLEGKSKEEADQMREEHHCLLKKYKEELLTPTFAETYLNPHSESPTPNTLVVLEQYDRLIAAHLHQLGPQLLTKIKEINNAGTGKIIPSGRVRAKVVLVDGSDGFADLKIISNKESREFSNNGITMDFTLISVSLEHKSLENGAVEDEDRGAKHNQPVVESGAVEDRGREVNDQSEVEGDEEDQLSQAFFSQSSISDASSFTATQSSAATTGEGETAVNVDEVAENDGFSLIFDEEKSNSPYISRPIFR